MADTKLSALTEVTALTDADELYVNDGGTSKRITAANARGYMGGTPSLTINGGRINTNGTYVLTRGPWRGSSEGSTARPANGLLMGLSYVAGGTPTTVSVEVGTAVAGDNVYYALYDVDEELMPTTLANSWGPFSTAATGMVSLTGQSETIVAGLYMVGAFFPTANTGSPAINGWQAGITLGAVRESTGTDGIFSYYTTSATATPPADLSAEVMRGNPPNTGDLFVPLLFGD